MDLRIFFTATHPQIFHGNHIDILFNGRLYNYNECKIVYNKKKMVELNCMI